MANLDNEEMDYIKNNFLIITSEKRFLYKKPTILKY